MQDFSSAKSKRSPLAQAWPLVVVGVLGLAVAVAAWIAVSNWDERLARAKFDDIAGDYLTALQAGLDEYVDELTAIQAFFHASQAVHLREFDLFTSRVLNDPRHTSDDQPAHTHDPIARILWSPLVAGADRASFERAQRALGFDGFTINRWSPTRRINPEPPHAQYFPVLFSTAHATDPGVIGMDLSSEPVRRDAIRRAIATGRMATAQNVILREPGSADPHGFFLALPVYRQGSQQPARRQEILGVLSGTFQTTPLMNTILDHAGLPGTVAVYLFGANADEQAAPLFSRSATQSGAPPVKQEVQAEPHWSAPLGVGDSRWDLFIVPVKGSFIDYRRAWFVVGVVALIFATVLAYMWTSLLQTMRLQTANRRILQLAQTDILTSLANRRAFLKRLKMAFAASLRGAPPFAVLYLDVDDFKDVNDTLGHAMGDELLKELVARLKTVVREGDLVARFGGDEFAILASNISDPTDAGTLAARIADVLAEPSIISGHRISVTSSIGIALFSREVSGPEAMMVQADLALYGAKDEGRNCYRFHSEDLDKQVHERVRVADELRTAIKEGDLELYYQPQVELATGRVTGAEALVRWNHKTRGLLTPGSFIAIAERTGVIEPLGSWVIDQACRQMKAWQAEGIAPNVLTVNVSGVQIKSAELERDVEESLAKWAVSPDDIELELTESVLMEATQRHGAALESLRRMGVRIAIDDFGTGYSSLKYLTTYPVNRLKLAQEFVFRVTVDYRNAAVVRASIGLAHELGIDVIAEGVETEAQVRFLLGAGCEQAQGYFFSRPLPADKVAAVLREGRIDPASAQQRQRFTSAA